MNLSNHYPSLNGRTVFVSGGGSGIGASLVEAFFRQGARVAFVDIIQEESRVLAERLNADKTAAAGEVRFYHCDLLDIPKLHATIAQVEQDMGAISVLINNAANDTRHDFRTIDPDDWDRCLGVNLRHQFFAAQAVYPQMQRLGSGSIINLGSMSWRAAQGGMPGYTSSKAGIEGLTRGLARDMGPDRIRVNTLVPGWVMTEKQLRERVDASTAAEIERNQCLKDSLMPEDISAMALFLASDDSRLCTAQCFIVDGGWV